MSKSIPITIFDTTLRDGEQAPGFSMTAGQKLAMAEQIAGLGADVIEAGFAAASPGDFEAIKGIAEAIGTEDGPVICSLSRAVDGDIHASGRAIAPAAKRRIHTFIATSPLHREYKLKMSKAEILDRAVAAVRLAREYTDDVEFSAEDAIRTERDYLAEVFEAAIEAGATTLNVPDTVGYTTPEEIRTCSSSFRPSGARRRSCSARTATTIWALRSPTVSPPCGAGRARSRARSTASASERATRRSRKSSWRSRRARTSKMPRSG